jgi:plasmid maintenance system antidote protein VapI
MGEPNFRLKGAIIEKFETQARAARELQINEFRLSRIIHGRAAATDEEKHRIVRKLQRPSKDLFF